MIEQLRKLLEFIIKTAPILSHHFVMSLTTLVGRASRNVLVIVHGDFYLGFDPFQQLVVGGGALLLDYAAGGVQNVGGEMLEGE